MGFFADMTAYKIAGLVLLIAGALLGFLCGKIARLSRSDDDAHVKRLSWIIKSAGLGMVVAAFIMILNS